MIRTERLTKIFRTPRGRLWRRSWEEKTAVRDLSLEMPLGRITGLLGVNGAGKTTTIKMLNTLLLPTSGHVYMGDIDVARHPDKVRPHINLIAGGERALYWRLTARENLWYFGQLYGIHAATLRAKIDELLARVELTDAADTTVEKYSKGMKQRLQVARGLLNDPRYLFMDEPTLGLDAPIARQLRRMTRELAHEHGRAVLLTSHYMLEVDELCDYIYVIDEGQVVSEGTPAAIKAMAGTRRTTRVTVSGWKVAAAQHMHAALARANLLGRLDLVDDTAVITVDAELDVTPLLVEAVSGEGRRILRVEALEPSLEDAIVAMAARRVKREPTAA
jgi:ABC-2 type transport system ATP-binding protein